MNSLRKALYAYRRRHQPITARPTFTAVVTKHGITVFLEDTDIDIKDLIKVTHWYGFYGIAWRAAFTADGDDVLIFTERAPR